jgi:hypothetical protein
VKGKFMKIWNQLNQITTQGIILAVLLGLGLFSKGSYWLSNLYFGAGMLLVLAGIIGILANAHLFSGWKINGNRQDQKLIDEIDQQPKMTPKEQIEKIVTQKNEPLKLSSITRLALRYALILIISSVVVSYF